MKPRYDEDSDSFQSLKPSRAKRSHLAPKIDRATEARLSSLEDQTERLSKANLALTGLLKRALHFVPSHLQSEYYRTWDAIKSGSFEGDIHP